MTTSADTKRDLERMKEHVRRVNREMLLRVSAAAHASIQAGSPITGAPGQPVDTGFLRASWRTEIQPDLSGATIFTDVAYAPVIEDNVRTAYDPAGRVNRYGTSGGLIGPAPPPGSTRRPIKSTVGGHHSVKLTAAALPRLAEIAFRDL